MPFKLTTTLPPSPLVRVFFAGLNIVKPSTDGSTCEIFVEKVAFNHELSIEVREKVPNHRDLILARIKGPFQFPVPGTDHGLKIEVPQAAGPAGIFSYVGSTTDEGGPLGTALDISHFHPGKTDVHKQSAQPSISMNEAIFYAADTTPDGLVIDLRDHNDVFVRRLTPFASLIGANIYRTTELIWKQNGQQQTLTLQARRGTPGLSYEVYVINDPLFEPLPDAGQQPHDELQQYYEILPQVPPNERFKMFFVSFPSGDRGSSRTPCMSLIDNG